MMMRHTGINAGSAYPCQMSQTEFYDLRLARVARRKTFVSEIHKGLGRQ